MIYEAIHTLQYWANQGFSFGRSGASMSQEDFETYYNTAQPESISYLEFGHINLKKSQKTVYDYYQHQKAYDWFMLARYANDLSAFIKMTGMLGQNDLNQILKLYTQEVQTDDFAQTISKLTGLIVCKKTTSQPDISFLELGSTLFGMIEANEFLLTLLNHLGIDAHQFDSHKIKFHGIEISELLLQMSISLHKDYQIHLAKKFNPEIHAGLDLFYSKGVCLLYVASTIGQLFELLNACRISIFDVSFSLGQDQEAYIGTGKKAVYLSYKDFCHHYSSRTDKQLYFQKSTTKINKDQNRVRGQAVFCAPGLMQKWIETDTCIRLSLVEKLSNVDHREKWIGPVPENQDFKNDWVLASDFIQA